MSAYGTPFEVRVVGMALNDFGFVAYNTIAGLGLNTWGMLWPCDGIWAPTDEAIVTTWADCGSGTTPTPEDCVD